MKNLKLSIIATAVLLAGNVFASSDIAGGDMKRLVYVQDADGSWTASGHKNGTEYVKELKDYYSMVYENRAKEINENEKDHVTKQRKLSRNQFEYNKLIYRLEKTGQEADRVLKNLNAGMSLEAAQNTAVAEVKSEEKEKAVQKAVAEGKPESSVVVGFEDTYDPADPSTSYNADSVTSSIMEGDSDASTDYNPTVFKQFNELDCSYDEVANYLDKTKSPKTKAFSTSPSFSGTFKKTASKSAAAVKGEDAAACQTIFHDINFDALDDLSISSISAGIPSFDDFGSMLDDLGNKASEQLGNLASDLYGVLREGFCSRLSSDYIGELAGDLIDDEYKEQTRGTNLEGTKINKLDSEAGQNNFTYTVIKNQSELSDSNLIKAIDVTREDQSKYQKKYLGGELDDYLDDLEKDIFG